MLFGIALLFASGLAQPALAQQSDPPPDPEQMPPGQVVQPDPPQPTPPQPSELQEQQAEQQQTSNPGG
jgi:hypothetical protein